MLIKSKAVQKIKTHNRCGLTIIELMIASAMVVIVVLGIAIVLSDSQRGYNAMYDRVYSEVVTGSHVAGKMFDAVVRKSSSRVFKMDADGQWIEVYYYADPNSVTLDHYARFFQDEGCLYVEYGRPDPRETLSVETVCDNVEACTFKHLGCSLQMLLTLNNGSQELTTVTSAVLHNY